MWKNQNVRFRCPVIFTKIYTSKMKVHKTAYMNCSVAVKIQVTFLFCVLYFQECYVKFVVEYELPRLSGVKSEV